MNGNAKDTVRTFLQARSHSDDKCWSFAFCYAIWIIRRVLNDRIKMTSYEKWHSIKPSFKDLTVYVVMCMFSMSPNPAKHSIHAHRQICMKLSPINTLTAISWDMQIQQKLYCIGIPKQQNQAYPSLCP
jgi:hypothetical protein